MEITEEQRKRSEANRLAALEKRRCMEERKQEDPWKLFRCRKIPSPKDKPPERFRAVLEICSPDEFSITPGQLPGYAFPGVNECFKILSTAIASNLHFRESESQGSQFSAKALIYTLKDFDTIQKCIKKLPMIDLQDIPYSTLLAVRTFQNCVANGLVPCWKEHYSEEQVNDLLTKLPRLLLEALLPFQIEGVRFGLRRGARCLIADEMGLGKTIQAIAIASCFLDKGPVLIVCPAVLRFSWAEELERWLPCLLPKDIHLVFGRQNNLDYLERSPKVVVISYTMLKHLRKSMLAREWSLVIVDESHNLRCTKKKIESEETKTVLDVAAKINRIILLSGTPSLTRDASFSYLAINHSKFGDFRPYDIYHQANILWPGLLGKDKYEFAKCYCMPKLSKGFQGNLYQDFSKGIRLEELNILLRQYVMIRRLKDHVLAQLPPKRRQIITLKLKTADISLATTLCKVSCGQSGCDDPSNQLVFNCKGDDYDSCDKSGNLNACCDKDYRKTSKLLSYQEIGVAKLSGFREWFSNHVVVGELGDADNMHAGLDKLKMIIFAHHLKVLDGVQDFVCEKGIQFVRIDGRTLPKDRQMAVELFRLSSEVKIAIIGITAGGVGLDFSSAQNVVFLELPKSASEMLQLGFILDNEHQGNKGIRTKAEDRAHRRGQTNAVNIYIFCAKGTSDELHWMHLNKSLFRVSSMMNGKSDFVKEIKVDGVIQLDNAAVNDEASCKASCTDTLYFDKKVKFAGMNEHIANICQCSILVNLHESEADAFKPPCHESSLKQIHDGSEPESLHSNLSMKICVPDMGNAELALVEKMTFLEKGKQSGIKNADGGPFELDSCVELLLIKEYLRFEVSRYTGRIHLYLCVPGKDLRPRPLFVNFRQEELHSIVLSVGDANTESASQLAKENPAYSSIFQTFVKEWSNLRPIERHKLLGKPLQLPLRLELCYLKEFANHGPDGLLKCGSKRRVTPLSEMSCQLLENAVWKKVVLFCGSAREKEYTQAWSINGEPLCKLCQSVCNGRLSTAPEFFEDLFCNLCCFQEYRVRTSQKALREALFQIEHGICSMCSLDCHKLVRSIKPLSISNRRSHIEIAAPQLAKKKKLLEKLICEPVEGNAWHADHIVPVFKGGGECRLENMRTLCVACHAEVTKAQRTERCLARKRAKQRLKVALQADLDPSVNNKLLDKAEGAEDGDIFIHVPGSAYSES